MGKACVERTIPLCAGGETLAIPRVGSGVCVCVCFCEQEEVEVIRGKDAVDPRYRWQHKRWRVIRVGHFPFARRALCRAALPGDRGGRVRARARPARRPKSAIPLPRGREKYDTGRDGGEKKSVYA